MASIESLNDGQRAVLQLLLRQGKSYEDIAGLLHSDAGAIRRRAHAAVQALGPAAADVSADRRNEIADYLLGQQTASQRAATREYLEASPEGRGWARGASTALARVAGADKLPDVPAEREEVAEAFDALQARTARQEEVQRSSSLGGKLISAGLGLVLAIVIIVVVALTGGDDSTGSGQTASSASVGRTGTTTTPGGTLRGDAKVLLAASLAPAEGSASAANGQAAIVVFPETKRYRFALAASKLPPSSTSGSAYGVWFYSSAKTKLFLGFPDTVVGRTGDLKTVADLSPDLPRFREVLLTRETSSAPKRPGTIVLRGPLLVVKPQGQQGATTTPPTQTTP